MKIITFCLLGTLSIFPYATDATTFTATVVNKTGEALYLTHGGVNNANDPLVCAMLTSGVTKQTIRFDLPSKSFPINPDGSADVMTNFTLNTGNTCAQAASQPISCTNVNQPYIKYGGIRFNNYGAKPGSNSVTITKNSQGQYVCTLQDNAYSTIQENMPYRQLNVGQNYLPLGGGVVQGDNPLPTRSDPLLDFNDYIANFDRDLKKPRMTVHYVVNQGQPNAAFDGNTGLLQLHHEQVFIQHNISTHWFDQCTQKQHNCQPFMQDGKAVPNKYVIWTPVSATLITGPSTDKTTIYTTVMPLVISNAIRAKTVSELVNPRMLWLVENKKIQDHDAILQGNWLNQTGQPNEAMLAPDGADPMTADPHDYLAIPINSQNVLNSDKPIGIVSLDHYFVMPHYPDGHPADTITYALSAHALNVNDTILKAYGLNHITQNTQLNPIAKLTGIAQVSYLTGQNGSSTGDYPSAANSDIRFAIDQGKLTVQKTQHATLTNLHGVYQINVKATDTTTGNSAYASFYVYIDHNTDNTLANWNNGGLPTFTILHFSGNQPFGSAYLYTSYDFTKPYLLERYHWKHSMARLFSDLAYANEHFNAHEHAAFVDINNLSFANGTGFWPVNRGTTTGATPYDLTSSIQPTGLMTNLDPTLHDGRPILKQLMTFLGKQERQTGISTALTIYPSNDIKAGFATFNPQQRNDLVDAAVAPLLYQNGDNAVSGLSLDFEGGLNSVGATQFYKHLTDKLAYRGKWFSFFYFTSMATPTFMESLGPLGALEISTYDAATFRAPGGDINQHIGLGAVDLSKQGYSPQDIQQLHTAYQQDLTCDTQNADGTVDHSVSWCNNTPNQTISENSRLWHSDVKATFQYGTPEQTMQLFHGKFQLVLPVSWTATEWTSLYVFNPHLGQPFSAAQNGDQSWKAGLFMVNKNQAHACSAAKLQSDNTDLQRCLLGNMRIAGVPIQTLTAQPDGLTNALRISGLPGTVPEKDGKWSPVKRLRQADYINANMYPYQDMLTSPYYVGLSAYSLQSYESIPASAKEAMGNNTGKIMTAIQMPWYVGFHPDTVPGTLRHPGYSRKTARQVWQAFGGWMQVMS